MGQYNHVILARFPAWAARVERLVLRVDTSNRGGEVAARKCGAWKSRSFTGVIILYGKLLLTNAGRFGALLVAILVEALADCARSIEYSVKKEGVTGAGSDGQGAGNKERRRFIGTRRHGRM